jgi:hypothetical protein
MIGVDWMSVNEMAVNEMSLCLHTKWLFRWLLDNMALD